MTHPQNPIPTTLEEINDALIVLKFDMDHKHYSVIEYFDLLTYMNNLKLEKAKLEAKEKEWQH